MANFAVIKTGGKQYIAREGETLFIEKIEAKVDDVLALGEVLMVDTAAGSKVGTPTVEGAKVTVKVLEQGRDKKVVVVHYLQKSRYHKKNGHRQPFTKVLIEKIAE
jgi:large subunit ribosomal protein L21